MANIHKRQIFVKCIRQEKQFLYRKETNMEEKDTEP